MSSAAIVARIACIASDFLVDHLPASPLSSSFAVPFQLALQSSSTHKPNFIAIPNGDDPAAAVLRASSAGFVSLTASSSAQTIAKLLPSSIDLASCSVVLHIELHGDLSEVLLLRAAVPYFVLSMNVQQTHDNALIASKLARSQRTMVVHAFFAGSCHPAVSLTELSEGSVLSYLLEDRHAGNSTKNLSAFEFDDDPDLLRRSEAYQAFASDITALGQSPALPLIQWSSADHEPHTVIFTLGEALPTFTVDGVAFVTVVLVTPLPPSRILGAIPTSVTRVIVLEQLTSWVTKWPPLYLDIVSALQRREPRPIVHCGVLGGVSDVTSLDIHNLLDCAAAPSTRRLHLGSFASDDTVEIQSEPRVPKPEAAYITLLSHLFRSRLDISNHPCQVATKGQLATVPEFALGRVRGQLEQRAQLLSIVQETLQRAEVDSDLHALLSQWTLSKDDGVETLGEEIVRRLETLRTPTAQRLLALRAHFPSASRWIIGSDAWSYDLGASGLHHVIASGVNVNILILDTTPYTTRHLADPHRRKHDIGLYAMNHGDVYVASIALYSSYAQTIQALTEADRFHGPSVVLAYLPYDSDEMPALEILKETKLAVDSGYWPLYRWNPSKELAGKEPFALDSDAAKADLQQFVDRQNHLSQLVHAKPHFAAELVSSLGDTLKKKRKKRAEETYRKLLHDFDAPPLKILYASDGGSAEKVAKRLSNRGIARGLSTTIGTIDSASLDSFREDEYVVFITATSGQGEPPQNGRQFFKALNAAVARGETPLCGLRFAVFGLGDSRYWPRTEDTQYYNKPSRDLDIRLERLGGQRVLTLGLGDAQDSDGYETSYRAWEPHLWKVLGVDEVEIAEAEAETITMEHLKAASNYLRGTIKEGLEDLSTGVLAASDWPLTKYHGIWQQDDRDVRDERQSQGVELLYNFMVRVRMPGGVCKPDQWLKFDRIADEYGAGHFKITTRQTLQFHGVIKRNLKAVVQAINRTLLDTLEVGGDINSNVVCSSIPTMSKIHSQVYQLCIDISEHLMPRTSAYHEIWLDKTMVAGNAVKDFEPLYGQYYLPRKFKIAIAVPPTNDVDVFTNDLGFIAIIEDGELLGYNVLVGGGMGTTLGNKQTYPRTADVIGFCTPEQGKYVAEAVVLVQRDYGNRVDRKLSRIKYTIDTMGLDTFKSEVEKRLRHALQPIRPFKFNRNLDDYGWTMGEDGNHHFTFFIENGRIRDGPGKEFKSGLREIAKVHKGTFRLTTNQHLVISDIPSEQLPKIKDILVRYNMDNLLHTGIRLSSSACVALPTCGLAMAESERYLPLLIDKVEKICEDNGLRDDAITMRMTGCPAGCSRPYVSEIGLVGKAPGTYLMLLGGGLYGQRLAKVYRESVKEHEIIAILKPIIKRYALERLDGERFGDFVVRAGYVSAVTSSKEWL